MAAVVNWYRDTQSRQKERLFDVHGKGQITSVEKKLKLEARIGKGRRRSIGTSD